MDSTIETYVNNSDLLKNYEEYKRTNISSNVLSKYERTAIIGTRATQLSEGAQPLCEVPKDSDPAADAHKIDKSVDIVEGLMFKIVRSVSKTLDDAGVDPND